MAGRVLNDWNSSANTMASSQMFYFLLVPLFALWLIYFKLYRRNLNKYAADIPGPPGYPIIGNLLDLMGSSHSEYTIKHTQIALSLSIPNPIFLKLSIVVCDVSIAKVHIPLQ